MIIETRNSSMFDYCRRNYHHKSIFSYRNSITSL